MEKLIEKLKSMKGKTLILTHHNADIDAVGSCLALKFGLQQLGINADLGVPESVSKPAKKLAENHFKIDPDCNNYDNIVLIDTSVPLQLKGVKNPRADIIIDHHPEGPLAKNAVCLIEPEARSSAQLILKILKQLNCRIDKEIAKYILAGITADTAHLRLAEKEEFITIAELLETGIKYSDILELLQTPSDSSEHIACLKAASRITCFKIKDILLVFSRVKSHEAAACRSLIKTGADIAVVANSKNTVRISSRAKPRVLEFGIDLSEIFKEVGKIINGTGGGHNLAGSANGKDKNKINDAFKYIRKEIEKKLKSNAKKII